MRLLRRRTAPAGPTAAPGHSPADSPAARTSAREAAADALADARRAATRVRREQEAVERYRGGKQAAPADRMTPTQWIGLGGGI